MDLNPRSGEPFFSAIYSRCIRSDRIRRHSFIQLCTDQFSLPEQTPNVMTFDGRQRIEVTRVIQFLSFLGQILGHLPYLNEEEPLLVIYYLSRLVELNGPALSDWFQAGGTNKIKDAKKQMQRKCMEAMALLIALQVKDFLVRRYSFSKLQCATFTPASNTRKASEKPIARQIRDVQLSLLKTNPTPSTEEIICKFLKAIKNDTSSVLITKVQTTRRRSTKRKMANKLSYPAAKKK